jgi:hypothetical protein
MLKLLRFLFGGEPLFGNHSTKGIFRNLEVNREEITPNAKLEHTEKNYRQTGMNKHEGEIKNYDSAGQRGGDLGNLVNTRSRKMDERITRNKTSNYNNKSEYEKQMKRFE